MELGLPLAAGSDKSSCKHAGIYRQPARMRLFCEDSGRGAFRRLFLFLWMGAQRVNGERTEGKGRDQKVLLGRRIREKLLRKVEFTKN